MARFSPLLAALLAGAVSFSAFAADDDVPTTKSTPAEVKAPAPAPEPKPGGAPPAPAPAPAAPHIDTSDLPGFK